MPPESTPPGAADRGAPRTTREFADYSLLRFPPGGGPLVEGVVLGLMEDFADRIARGEVAQIVPGGAAPSREHPGAFDVGDGRHRFEACRRMGLPFRAEVRDAPYAKGELNRIRAGSLMRRKKANPFELAQIVTDHRRDLGLPTWAEAAADLGIPASTLSNITVVKRIPEDLRPALVGHPTVAKVVARMPGRAAMEKLIAFARLDGDDPRTKDEVELFAKRLKAGTPKGPPPRPVLEVRGKMFSAVKAMLLFGDMRPSELLADLRELTALVSKHHGDYDMPALVAILNGFRPPEGGTPASPKGPRCPAPPSHASPAS